MKVKIRLSSTRKFVLSLEHDTLGELKDKIRSFITDTCNDDVREPVCVSLNGKDVLCGGDDTPLASLGVVPGDLLTVVPPDSPPQAPPHPTAAPPPTQHTKEHTKPKTQEATSSPVPTSQPQSKSGVGDGGGGGAVEECGVGDARWPSTLLVDAVDGTAPPALEELLGQCGPASLSASLNLLLHLTMLECGFLPDGATQPPQGWAEAVAVLPYHSAAHPDFRCKLVLMDVGREKQVMASFPEQAGEVKHSLVMADHLKGNATSNVAAKDLIGVAQLSRRLRDAVLLPLQVAAHQALGVPAPWHMAGLPQELILAVAMRLNYNGVVALASTCRHLRSVLADNRLWHNLYRRDFPTGASAGTLAAGVDWRDRYREAVRCQKEREKLLREGHFVIPGVYPEGPFPRRPHPGQPFPLHPNPFSPRPNPFADPDSPYFTGEVPPVPGVYPEMPDPLGPIGPLGPLGPLNPGHPYQPPFMPPGRPRNPRGPRFDFFL